jgi:predicted phage-related endonuclease
MRKTGIGSSDAPIIAGEVGSVVALWAEKSGLVSPPEPDAPLAELFEWGHRLEPVVAKWYADTTGRPLKRTLRAWRGSDDPAVRAIAKAEQERRDHDASAGARP